MKTNEYQKLTNALKIIIKNKKWTYRQLAEKIKISESTLKRTLNASDGSLNRLMEIAEVMGVSFLQLVEQAKFEDDLMYSFNLEQEIFFSKNLNYLNFFTELCFYKGNLKEITKNYQLNDKSIDLYIKKLQKLGLIEYHQNKVNILVSGSLNYILNGPLQQVLSKKLLNSAYDKCTEAYKTHGINRAIQTHFCTGSVYKISNELASEFNKKMRKLSREMIKKAYQDETSDKTQQYKSEYVWYFVFAPETSHHSSIPNIDVEIL